ncbi:MAG: DUF4830 domain-containing protein [Clostridia bacterium]|nr:DUF4830 domain-containing protein [Clostridia bacterium]
MFIYTLKASTVKFFAVVCVSLVAIITLIAFVPAYGESVAASGEAEITYTGVKTNEDRIAFLSQFGWEVKETPIEECEVTIPEEFDKIFTGYNEIQKRQGLDLSDYKKKKAVRYTYEITNYEGATGTVYANVIVYRNRVIGGDVCSADVTGFIHGFEK